MLQNNMLNNLFKSQAQMEKYFTQIYTGKKISRPSDDPVIAMKGMGYRTQVTEVEQFRRNALDAWNWMDHSDDVLDKATKAVQRMEYLAVQAANGSYSEDERISVMKEVEQLQEQLVELANTKVNGKYIFNGTNTDKPPINPTPDENGKYHVTFGDGDGLDEIFPVQIEISKGIKIPINVSPEGIFDQELFDNINGFINALKNDDNVAEGEATIDDSIEALNKSMLNIVNGRAELGARMNRVELIEDRLAEQEIIAKDTMMKNEGVDFEEAVTNLLTQEVIHRAALSAGAKIIQPSLIDFLR